MKKQIKHVAVHQSSKVLGILYFILSAIIVVPLTIYELISIGDPAVLISLITPFFWGAAGYVSSAVTFWVYNLVASSFGGIEVTFNGTETKS